MLLTQHQLLALLVRYRSLSVHADLLVGGDSSEPVWRRHPRVGREGQALQRSPGHLGKWKSAHPAKNHVKKCQLVSSYVAHMDQEIPHNLHR